MLKNSIRDVKNSVREATERLKELAGQKLDNIIALKNFVLSYMDDAPASHVFGDAAIVSNVLHYAQSGASPRVALVGMTSAGKSSLINSLFGKQISEVALTPDTTNEVIRVEFSSGVVVFDTPGIWGDGKNENVTRLFLGLAPHSDLPSADAIPFRSTPESEPVSIEASKIAEISSVIDAVLLVFDSSRTITRTDKKEYLGFVSGLKRRFGSHITVAATRIDQVGRDEKGAMLSIIKEIVGAEVLPVSNKTKEGFGDLVAHLFRSLPPNINLATLQEALNDGAKLGRLSFVIKEASDSLAKLMLYTGSQEDEIKAFTLLIYSLICHHYSVDEKTWLKHNGNAIQLSEHIKEHGKKEVQKIRPPEKWWEKFTAFFGKKFFKTAQEDKAVGLDCLKLILPQVYTLLFSLSGHAGVKFTDQAITEHIEKKTDEFEPLVLSGDEKKIASIIVTLLSEMLKKPETQTQAT